ncbi:hypothetical protein GCM10009638_16560 [Luteococcus sanguinis]
MAGATQVLQSRRVEDDIGLVLGEDGVEGGLVADVAQHHVACVQQALVPDAQLGGVQARLVAVEQDELFGPELVYLAGDLAANADEVVAGACTLMPKRWRLRLLGASSRKAATAPCAGPRLKAGPVTWKTWRAHM